MLIIFWDTIDDLFNHLEDIFSIFYYKKYVMGKFHELKMSA